MSWFALSFGAALTQAAQFAVVKGRARGIAPLVIVTWTQAIATASWAAFFLVTGHAFALPRFAWPAVAVCAVLVMGMSGLLARASARGDISIVGPVFALSPIFTVLPDAALSGTWPSPLGWVGLSLSVLGTSTLSGSGTGGAAWPHSSPAATRSMPSAPPSSSVWSPRWIAGAPAPSAPRAISSARTAPPLCWRG